MCYPATFSKALLHANNGDKSQPPCKEVLRTCGPHTEFCKHFLLGMPALNARVGLNEMPRRGTNQLPWEKTISGHATPQALRHPLCVAPSQTHCYVPSPRTFKANDRG